MSRKILKLLVGILFAAVISMPFVSSAQQSPSIEELVAQIQSLLEQVQNLQRQIAEVRAGQGDTLATSPVLTRASQTVTECPVIQQSLSRGSTDKTTNGTVSDLQRFLMDKGHFVYPDITGFFGPITEEAVQAFQRAQGIVSFGTPASTGYGVVGPRTRSTINAICGFEPVLPPLPPAPTDSSDVTTAPTPINNMAPLTVIIGPNGSPNMIQQAVVGQITLTLVQEILLDWNGDGVLNTTDARLAQRAVAGEISWTELVRMRDSGAWEDAITTMKRFVTRGNSNETVFDIVFGPGGGTTDMQQAILGSIDLNPIEEMLVDFNGDGVLNTTDVRLAERVGDLTWAELLEMRNNGLYKLDVERMRTVLDTSNTNPIPLVIGPGATTQTMQEAIVGATSLNEVQRTLLDFSGDGVMNTTDVRLAERAVSGEISWSELYSMRDNGAHSAEIARMKYVRDETPYENPLPALLGSGATTQTLQEAVVGNIDTTKTQRILLDWNGDSVLNTTDVRLAERAVSGELTWASLKEARDDGLMQEDIERMKNITSTDLSWSELKRTRDNGVHAADIKAMKSLGLGTNQNPLEAIMFTGATTATMQEAVVGNIDTTKTKRILLDWNGDGVLNTTDVRLAERVGDLTWEELVRGNGLDVDGTFRGAFFNSLSP